MAQPGADLAAVAGGLRPGNTIRTAHRDWQLPGVSESDSLPAHAYSWTDPTGGEFG